MKDGNSRLFRLDGQVALVTGASAGLGAHFAQVLAGAGASVALGARRMVYLRETAAAIEKAGGTAFPIPLDVTDPTSVAAAFETAERTLGRITIIVNNAGVASTGPALDMAPADWDLAMDTNLKGAWLVAREGARRMAADDNGRGGSIVNIGSIAGQRVAGGLAAYAASKAGLLHLTRALALEWARYGIRVNAIAPGYIETDINRQFFATEAGEKMIRRIPQRRLGKPDDLDGPLLLLASDASRHMTGTVITIDGGHSVNSL